MGSIAGILAFFSLLGEVYSKLPGKKQNNSTISIILGIIKDFIIRYQDLGSDLL